MVIFHSYVSLPEGICISESCWSLLPCHPHGFLDGPLFPIELRAPAEEILKLMDVVVTGDEVKRGKPQRLGEGLVPRGKHGKTTSVTGEHGGTIGSVMSWGNPLVGLVLLLFAIGVGVCTKKI